MNRSSSNEPSHPPALRHAALAERKLSDESRRIALIVFCISFGLFLALAPFAKLPLAPVPLFVPVNQVVLIVNDLITVVLLLGQLRLARSRPVLVLACGYMFSAVMATIHMLSFPGAFAPKGVVGGGAQSTAYLYIFWHMGIALFAIAYAYLRDHDGVLDAKWASRAAAWIAAAVVLALAAAYAAIEYGDWLPQLLAGNTYSSSFNVFRHGQWLLMAGAALAVWRSARRSVLDLWLAISLCASIFEIGLVAVLNAGRFDVGFYTGRVYSLFASSCVLVMLLIEQVRLHADLARARDDIARQMEAERALRQADTRKDEFLATLSHELRNPLAPIRNAVQLLSRMPLPEPAAGTVAVLDRQSRHLTRLVDDLLEISRITQGKLQLHIQRVSLNACVRDAVEAVRGAIGSASQRLEFELADRELMADGDGTRITQCVLNLLTNASKFTPAGGTIRVELLAHAGDTAVISVSDTGVGIAPEHLGQIFDKFSQVSPALQRTHGGLGIGLALVKALVQLHHGEIRAMSAGPGKGSTFEITLPLAADARAHAAHSALTDARPAADAPLRVLVVDDNVDAANLLAESLKLAGHDVRQAHDGVQCLETVRWFAPDAILMDIGMPRMNGLDAAKALRAEGNQSLIVAVTGWDQEHDRDATRRSGFDLHLTKPVDVEQVASLLDNLRQGSDSVL
jgi:signal transduction histidine kinase/CheY-like chemotaxis protein